MTTGKHTIQTISCSQCQEYLGWTYIHVPGPDQQYKLGKTIIEIELVSVLNSAA